MALLAGVNYDPAVAVSKSTASRIAMTALDTTNLRLTFTAPASGNVLVRLRCMVTGSTTAPRIFLGVLDGSTIQLRGSTMGGKYQAAAGEYCSQEVVGVVTGLTPGNSYTWDAAYSVDVLLASTNIKYGGPNDASGADAFGGFLFEVWDAANLLAGTWYDPGSVATASATSLLAMTALDTTNLRLTFTAPASGKVQWRIRTQVGGPASTPWDGSLLLGVLEGASVVARIAPVHAVTSGLAISTPAFVLEASGIIAVSAGSHTFDAAYAVQAVAQANGIRHGGPDDTTTNNAWGGTGFEIWAA